MTACNSGVLGPSRDEELWNPTLMGDVKLDAAAAIALADGLCKPLEGCLRDTFHKIMEDGCEYFKVANLEVTHSITLSDFVAKQLAQRICGDLKQCIIDTLNGGTITGMTLINATIRDSVLDADTMNRIFDYFTGSTMATSWVTKICAYMQGCIRDNLEGHSFNNVTLNTPIINGGTLNGATVTQTTFTNNIFTDNKFYGEIIFDEAAEDAVCAAVQGCVLQWIDDAYATLRAIVDEHSRILAEHEGRLNVLEQCKPKDYVDCEGNSIECQPLITVDCLEKRLAEMKTCDDTPVGTQKVATCLQVDAKIADIDTCTGKKGARRLVACDEIEALVKGSLLKCGGGVLGDEPVASCSDLEEALKGVSGGHSVHMSLFTIADKGAATKTVNAPLVLAQDSVVYVTAYGWVVGGANDHKMLSATQLLINGVSALGGWGYPYKDDELMVDPTVRSMFDFLDAADWADPILINEGKQIPAGTYAITALFSGAPWTAYVDKGFLRIDVIPVKNLQPLAITSN